MGTAILAIDGFATLYGRSLIWARCAGFDPKSLGSRLYFSSDVLRDLV